MRRGPGSDVASSRPYEPGDNVDRIDWAASARLSLARGTEEFVVREHFAEEAPRVVVLSDRRPSMSIFPQDLPWLHKADAARQAAKVIVDSAVAARGLLGYFDEADGDAYWHPPRSQHELGELDRERPFRAAPDTLERGLRHLVQQRRDLPAGTFVFLVSDFLVEPSRDDWLRALERRWEIVPVVARPGSRAFPTSGAPWCRSRTRRAGGSPSCASRRRRSPVSATRTSAAIATSSGACGRWTWIPCSCRPMSRER
jgi:uncharacterized protein (DUF58 family)